MCLQLSAVINKFHYAFTHSISAKIVSYLQTFLIRNQMLYKIFNGLLGNHKLKYQQENCIDLKDKL
jgi:hypothetical protein